MGKEPIEEFDYQGIEAYKAARSLREERQKLRWKFIESLYGVLKTMHKSYLREDYMPTLGIPSDFYVHLFEDDIAELIKRGETVSNGIKIEMPVEGGRHDHFWIKPFWSESHQANVIAGIAITKKP